MPLESKQDEIDISHYQALSDSSAGKLAYVQTGYISDISIPTGRETVVHVVNWVNEKLNLVSFFSIGAQNLAATALADRGSQMAVEIEDITRNQEKLPFVLSVDPNGLYSTINTFNEGCDYRLQSTVFRLRKLH